MRGRVRGLLLIGVLAASTIGCGLLPGADEAGRASVPEFPKPTLPPPNPPDPGLELANQAFERATTTTAPVDDVLVETPDTTPSGPATTVLAGSLAEAANATTTTEVDVLRLSETCLAVYRLKQVGFQLWSTGFAADEVRLRSMVQQVETEMASVEIAVGSGASREALVTLRTGLERVAADHPEKDTFAPAFADFLAANAELFDGTMGRLSAICPEVGAMWPPLGPEPTASFDPDQVIEAFTGTPDRVDG